MIRKEFDGRISDEQIERAFDRMIEKLLKMEAEGRLKDSNDIQQKKEDIHKLIRDSVKESR